MADIEKLNEQLKGRTISGTGNRGDEMVLHFTDDSSLTVKTANTGTNSASTGGTIASVAQTETHLILAFEGGGTQEIPLASPDAPVTFEDKSLS
jgi:hypothetical protein